MGDRQTQDFARKQTDGLRLKAAQTSVRDGHRSPFQKRYIHIIICDKITINLKWGPHQILLILHIQESISFFILNLYFYPALAAALLLGTVTGSEQPQSSEESRESGLVCRQTGAGH